MSRRVAFGQAAGAATAAAAVVALPQVALADGAVSPATILRSKGIYGERILGLKDAVNKGDFSAVADEKNAFILFNSGAYPGSKLKAKKNAAIAKTNEIFSAVKAGDKAALKSAYESYVKDNEIVGLPAVDPSQGQGYSGDFDYRVKTKSAAIYVR